MSTIHPASFTATPAIDPVNVLTAPPEKKTGSPIQLRQAKVRHSSGVLSVRIDLQVENAYHVYSIGVYAGFVGGGRDAEMALAPRTRAHEFIPKFTQPGSGKLAEIWPPMPAFERRVDGRVWPDTHLPEGDVPQRLEKAIAAIEPLLRQMVNQRQVHVEDGKVGLVADHPLVARIKHILANY